MVFWEVSAWFLNEKMAMAKVLAYTPKHPAASKPCLGLCQGTCVSSAPWRVVLGPLSPHSPGPAHIRPLPLPDDPHSPGPASGTLLTWEQCTTDHAWHDDQAHGQHLEVAGQDGARFGMVQVPGRQRPLHDDLWACEERESQPLSGVPVVRVLPGGPQG